MLQGERLRGAWALVRTRGQGGKPQWLLIKRTDDGAHAGGDVVAEHVTSVVTGRTMAEIAGGVPATRSRTPAKKTEVAAPTIEPMYASIGAEIPSGTGWTFEPKYDGIRVLAFATADAARGDERADAVGRIASA